MVCVAGADDRHTHTRRLVACITRVTIIIIIIINSMFVRSDELAGAEVTLFSRIENATTSTTTHKMLGRWPDQ